MGFTIVGDNDPNRGHPHFICRDDIKSYESDDIDALEVRTVMEGKGFTFTGEGREVCFVKGSVLSCSDEQPRPKGICIAALRAVRKEKELGQ